MIPKEKNKLKEQVDFIKIDSKKAINDKKLPLKIKLSVK
jgi:hypothetical protein